MFGMPVCVFVSVSTFAFGPAPATPRVHVSLVGSVSVFLSTSVWNSSMFCPTVRPSVRPFDRPPVRPSVRPSDRPSVRSFDRPTVRLKHLLVS